MISSFSVKNPNFFSATLKSLQAKAFYPPLTSQVGGGSLSNVVFPSDSNTNFLFPFIINYSTAIDPQNILIQDLINKCGIKPGSTMEPLTINYDIAVSVIQSVFGVWQARFADAGCAGITPSCRSA